MRSFSSGLCIVFLFSGRVTAVEVSDEIAHLRAAVPRAKVTLDGGEIRRIHGAAVSFGGTPERSAEAFLDARLGAFGVARAMVRHWGTHEVMSGEFTVLAYRQWVGNVPVYDCWLKLLIRNTPDHPLVLVNSSLRAMDDEPGRARTVPAQALGAVRDAEPSLVNFSVTDLVYYPMEHGEVSLSWHFFADNGAARGHESWEYFVDAIDGGVLARRPGILHNAVEGVVAGMQSGAALPDQPNNAPTLLAVSGARVRGDNGATGYSDEFGTYALGDNGSDATRVELDLVGQWCTVINAGEGGDLAAGEDVDAAGTADFSLNDMPDEFFTSQLNAITAVTTVHDFLRATNPSTGFLDVSIPTFVNAEGTCNAAYSLADSSLTFFGAGDGCPNTAYASVIYHEYGHFLIDKAPGGPDSLRYHEGMADGLSMLLRNDPCVGRDLRGQDEGCLRDPAAAGLRYPCFGSPHFCGQVLGGALWDMRTNLIDTLGEDEGLALARELFVGQILTGLHTMAPGVTIDLLVLDDDDDNVSNGTPHYHAINGAFAEHGMPGPTVLFNDGDYNGDGDIDLADYAAFHDCTTGPDGSIPEECTSGDFDGDGDIDLLDFRRVSSRFTGDCGVLLVQEPESVTACFGDLVLFTMSGVGNVEEYVWTHDGVIVSGANNQILVINPVTAGTLGRYRGVVVGGCAAAVSEEVTLSLPDPPIIVELPEDVATCVGESATFAVVGTGWETLGYQWRRDDVEIVGATDAAYTIDSVTHDDIGIYTCVVSDRCGQSASTESAPVSLSLIPPDIVTQPQQFLTCEGLGAEFNIEVAGPPPIGYQWRFEGVDIPGAVSPMYAIESVTDDDLGVYRCVVSDGCGGSVISQAARLRYGNVVLNSQPAGGTFCAGELIFMIAGAADGVSFQWFKDGLPVPGAISPFLVIQNATPEDSGTYHLLANGLCNEITSEDVIVTVIACTDGS